MKIGAAAFLVSLSVACCLPTAASDGFSTGTYEPGTATSTVVALTPDNFEKAVKEDSANPFWLLKFYAPWCGHCKRLAPVLDKVAPQLAGQMSFGTIDCTLHKPLCDQYKVRGYPTLKFAIDGNINDYPGGRGEHDFIEFSEKMHKPIIDLVTSVDEAKQYTAEESADGVAFLAYHPAVEGETLDDKIATSGLTQSFAQAARVNRASGTYMLLDTSSTSSDEEAAAVAAELGDGPFICRLEALIEPRCYPKIGDVIPTKQLLKWIDEQSVPTVSQIGAHNFQKLGRGGKSIVIAVVESIRNNPEQVDLAKKTLAEYATTGKYRSKFVFGWFDGSQWKKFLEQFDISPKELPQTFAVHVGTRAYYQNATYALNVGDFVQAMQDGKIEKRTVGPKGWQGMMVNILYWTMEHQTESIIGAVVLVIAFIAMCVKCCRPSRALRPPYKKDGSAAAATDGAKNEGGKDTGAGDKAKDDEPKKEK